jgi:DNA polymerase-3 subunit epsilon
MLFLWPYLKARYLQHRLRRRHLPAEVRENLNVLSLLDVKRPTLETDFVVFDTETTGLNPKGGDSIVSLSAVRVKHGRIDLSDLFHELINPDRPIPPPAVIIHEILPRMVAGKPTLEKVLPRFIGYVGSSVLVAHHAKVDVSFLNLEMRRLYGFPIQNIVLDTVQMDQMLVLKKTPISMRRKITIKSSLSVLAERYHVAMENQHTSLGDALTTAQIFQVMLREAQGLGIFLLRDLVRSVFLTGTYQSPFIH